MVTMKDKDLLKLLLKNGWHYQTLKAAITSLPKTVKLKLFPFMVKI